MSTEFRIFLLLPNKLIFYSLADPKTGKPQIFNAGSLESIPNPTTGTFTEISGMATSSFNVKPVVVAYSNNTYEILYAPSDSDYVFRTDGQLAKHQGSPVILKSVIQIPDISKYSNFQELPKLKLDEPNEKSINDYIKMSRENKEYNLTITYRKISDLPCDDITSPSPLVFPTEQCTADSVSDIVQLREEVKELRSIVESLIKRVYQIGYPINVPKEIKYDGKEGNVITFDEIQTKLQNNEVEKMEMVALLQPYAGSHRSSNRMLTFHTKDGETYHVRGSYDAKTNKLDPPK